MKEEKTAPSIELKKLIDHIRENGIDTDFALCLNSDGILYPVYTCTKCGKPNVLIYDFGFDCADDSDFFYLFKRVPDDDPIEILLENGIEVSRLESYYDMNGHCSGCDGGMPTKVRKLDEEIEAQMLARIRQEVVINDDGSITDDHSIAEVKSASTFSGGSLNSNVKALLTRGQMCLEDGEWERAEELYEQVLNQDAQCGEAYLGKWMAKKAISSLSQFTQTRLMNYKHGFEPLTVNGLYDPNELQNMAVWYHVDGYFSSGDALAMLTWPENKFQFASTTKKWTDAIQFEKDAIEKDRLLNRALQYLDANQSEKVKEAIDELFEALEQLRKKSVEEDEENVSRIAKKYDVFITDAMRQVKERSETAQQYREAYYQESCALQEKAATAEDFSALAERFQLLRDYKDSVERERYNKARCKRFEIVEKRKNLLQEKQELERELTSLGVFSRDRKARIRARLQSIDSILAELEDT